ncbi:MAG: threonine/serine exporter family protein [Bacteroides sp.]|nr:threonine/serine exporter family protein [Bacteroides sp.]
MNVTTATTDPALVEQRLRPLCRFLARYASAMLGCGATGERIVKNIRRMAAVADATVDIIILPAHIDVSVTDYQTGCTCQLSRPIDLMPVSYNLNTLLSKLSWKVAERKVSLEDACPMFDRIMRTKPLNKWKVMGVVTLANASFCRLFGGDPAAMLIVAAATCLGYTIKNLMLEGRNGLLFTVLVCAFISAVTASGGYLFSLTATPDVALGTSVLYLIPGIPYINSVNDLITGHYLCAVGRFLHAAMITACIALGLTATLLIMNLGMVGL